MNILGKLLVLIMVFSILYGQTIFVFARENTEKKPTQKKQAEPYKKTGNKTRSAKKAVKNESNDTTWVGRGYDITDKYADVGSVREAVFAKGADESGKTVIIGEAGNGKIDTDAKRTSKYDEFSGKSLSEYQSSFSNKLSIGGSFKIFSAQVSVNNPDL
ncbi:MAG: hypothetical protein ABJA66_18425 [Actinomycetota bacterium]